MKDFLTTINESSTLSPKARREALLPLASNTELARAIRALYHEQNTGLRRAIARALADLAIDQKCRDHMLHQMALLPALPKALLASDDAKLRKNFVELLGRLDADAFASLLIEAYDQETIEYVKPSILLALGNAQSSEEARDFLKTVTLDTDTAEKHNREQTAALRKAQDSLSPRDFHPLPHRPMERARDVILSCPNARITVEELRSLGYDAKPFDAKSGLCVVHNVRTFRDLYKARTFYEAGTLLFESDSLRHAVSGVTSQLLSRAARNLYGTDDLSFRMDVAGQTITQKERMQAYDRVNEVLSLAHSRLHNSPSSYDFELRISCLGKRFIVWMLPGAQNDLRFAYRQQAISASMHPAVAASCARVIAGYNKGSEDVLDCFCGAGTFLLERAQYPYASLSGSDIAPAAIRIAKANAAAAGCKADLFVKNASTPFQKQYDEIIGNMPFGLRVSNHAANQELYRAFFENLKTMLRPNGRAFLFTNEKKLMQTLLGDSFVLEGKINFSAGGLYPSLYILHYKA